MHEKGIPVYPTPERGVGLGELLATTRACRPEKKAEKPTRAPKVKLMPAPEAGAAPQEIRIPA